MKEEGEKDATSENFFMATPPRTSKNAILAQKENCSFSPEKKDEQAKLTLPLAVLFL